MCVSSNPAVKARQEVVELVWQCAVCGVGGCVAVVIASQSLSPLPHASAVVSVKVLLYALLVAAFGLIDVSPQASLSLLVGLQVPRLKHRIPGT